eukprot:g15664.t1
MLGADSTTSGTHHHQGGFGEFREDFLGEVVHVLEGFWKKRWEPYELSVIDGAWLKICPVNIGREIPPCKELGLDGSSEVAVLDGTSAGLGEGGHILRFVTGAPRGKTNARLIIDMGSEEELAEMVALLRSIIDTSPKVDIEAGLRSGEHQKMMYEPKEAAVMTLERHLEVGKYKSKLDAQGWECEMQGSFLEIYNEQHRGMLREITKVR